MQLSRSFVAPALLVTSATSLYCGAAAAINLFGLLSPLLVAWLRVAVAGVILMVLFRPSRQHFFGRQGRIALIFGLAMIGMNMSFYEAISRIPMGTAVAIEFLGPAVVAALGSRTRRDVIILVTTVTGVLLVAGPQWTTSPLGILFALGAAAGWGLYIMAGVKIAHTGMNNTSLGISLVYAAVVTAPIAFLAAPKHTDALSGQWGRLVGLVLLLAVLSTVLPTLLDQAAMRRAGRDVFSVLSALYPATAAVLGAVVLGQMLSMTEIVGVILVVVAVAARRAPQRPSPGGRRRQDADMLRDKSEVPSRWRRIRRVR